MASSGHVKEIQWSLFIREMLGKGHGLQAVGVIDVTALRNNKVVTGKFPSW